MCSTDAQRLETAKELGYLVSPYPWSEQLEEDWSDWSGEQQWPLIQVREDDTGGGELPQLDGWSVYFNIECASDWVTPMQLSPQLLELLSALNKKRPTCHSRIRGVRCSKFHWKTAMYDGKAGTVASVSRELAELIAKLIFVDTVPWHRLDTRFLRSRFLGVLDVDDWRNELSFTTATKLALIPVVTGSELAALARLAPPTSLRYFSRSIAPTA